MLETLPVLVVHYPVLLPEATAFIVVAGAGEAALARAARRSEDPFTFAVFIRQRPSDEPAGPTRLLPIGCAAVVEKVVVEHGQLLGMRVRGLARVQLIGTPRAADGALTEADIVVLDARTSDDDGLLRAQLARVRTRLHAAHPPIEAGARATLVAVDDPGHFADALAAQFDDLSPAERLQLLTTAEPAARLILAERLLAARTAAPARELGRVWAALRSPIDTVPGQSTLREQARGIDVSALHDPQLRRVVEDIARSEPIPVIDANDDQEQQLRRETLAQLTSAIRSLTALRGCASPDDAEDVAVQAEIAAAIGFLFVIADSEHAAITGAPPADAS